MRFTNFTLLVLLLSTATLTHVSIQEEAKDILQEQIDRYHEVVRSDGSEDQYYASRQEQLKSTKFMCTDGKNPADMTRKDYITAFAIGPCTPAIVLPGIAGSKLRVEVDCEKFKEAHPEDFASCGWKRCSGLQSPKKEYKMWIPALLAPMSIFIDSAKNRKCFTAVFGFDDSQAIPAGKLIYRTGLKVTVEGNTPDTKSKKSSNCAWSAITDLSTVGKQTPATAYFK